ncbi:unnamed protein product [Sphagnum troendelagicum]|uniref:Uncharacterized protein n=1 Tax=Sphagnum troendelagicum TaxID=128251 RepID=A0ABP0TUG8_9BRYO
MGLYSTLSTLSLVITTNRNIASDHISLLLAVDSPGDGDDEEGSKTVGKSKKRRQRRSKSLKAAVSSASPGISRSPLGILKCTTTTTSSCSVSTQASSSSTEAEKDFGVSIAERSSAAEARQGLDSPSDHVLTRSPRPIAELRQRSVADKHSDAMTVQQENGIEGGGGGARGSSTKLVSFKEAADPSYLGRVHAVEPLGHRTPPQARQPLASFGTPHLTEWDRLMAANSDYPTSVDLSPIQYLRREIQRGSALEHHSSINMEQKRDRVYNTMFHVPWRCELLIDVGFFLCLDSFLTLCTVMPARIVMYLWQHIVHWRQFQRPYAAELSDFSSLIILVMGVTVLQQADISFIYHYIRGQATIKLYVVFNVLEIFDKLCQSFGGDVLQVLLNAAVTVGECPLDKLIKAWLQFCLDQSIACFGLLTLTFWCSLMHSLVIMSQAITISAAINSQNNMLLTLLISNNFAEIKSNVFKRVGKDNLHKMAYHDTVERFHIMTHLLFVLAQNILNNEDSWILSFAYNAGMVLLCEVLVDVIKHSFLAKFNEIKPEAYSEFLQALCKQTVKSQSHEVHKTLQFVPLAPACVVLRVLIPLYVTLLPQGFWQRWTSILLLGGATYIILLALKILVGLGLQMHAAWYLKRCRYKEAHPHAD